MPKSPLCECSGQVSVTHFQPLQSYCSLLALHFFIFPDWLECCFTRTSLTRPLPIPEWRAPWQTGWHINDFRRGHEPQGMHVVDTPVLPCLGSWASENEVDGNIIKPFKMTIIDFDGGARWRIIAVNEQSNAFSCTRLSRFTCRILHWFCLKKARTCKFM